MKKTKKIFFGILSIIAFGLLLPQTVQMPVEGATKSDYNKKSFWAYPWGKSVTHKGVDVFAKKGTNIKPLSPGFVLYSGNIPVGGNIVVVLGAKWRLHYYAHMNKIKINRFNWASKNDIIGTVGDSGNAKGKPPHLHYSIMTAIPYPWQIDCAPQGWRKAFYINPIPLIK